MQWNICLRRTPHLFILLINFWPRTRHITYLHNFHALLHCLFCILFLYYDNKSRAVSATLRLWYTALCHWCPSVTAHCDRTSQGTQLLLHCSFSLSTSVTAPCDHTSQGTQLLLHCSFSLSTHLARNAVPRAMTRSHPETFVLMRQQT